jgi:hypothetical protein
MVSRTRWPEEVAVHKTGQVWRSPFSWLLDQDRTSMQAVRYAIGKAYNDASDPLRCEQKQMPNLEIGYALSWGDGLHRLAPAALSKRDVAPGRGYEHGLHGACCRARGGR